VNPQMSESAETKVAMLTAERDELRTQLAQVTNELYVAYGHREQAERRIAGVREELESLKSHLSSRHSVMLAYAKEALEVLAKWGTTPGDQGTAQMALNAMARVAARVTSLPLSLQASPTAETIQQWYDRMQVFIDKVIEERNDAERDANNLAEALQDVLDAALREGFGLKPTWTKALDRHMRRTP